VLHDERAAAPTVAVGAQPNIAALPPLGIVTLSTVPPDDTD
jgi:hypothetical protein